MKRESDAVKAPEVKSLVDVMDVRLKDALEKLTRLDAKQEATDRTLSDYRREQDRDFALLKQRVDDIRDSREKWVMRAWGLVGPIIGVVLGYYLRR